MAKIDVPAECEKWAKFFSEAGKLLLLLLALWLLFHLSGCGFAMWRDQLMADVEAGRWHVDPGTISGGSRGLPIRGVTIYSPSGRALGTIR